MLLRRLARIRGIEWIRLMYAYPGRISKELMTVMAAEEKICKYLDIPIQHFDDKVLATINRRGTSEDIRKTIEQLRKCIPGIALRTSLIVGFPGETEAAYKRLLAYIREAEFEHLGVFTYSPEEGTAANTLKPTVTKDAAMERYTWIMQAQAKISLKKNRALIGATRRVLVDGMEDMVLAAASVAGAGDRRHGVSIRTRRSEVRRRRDHRCHRYDLMGTTTKASTTLPAASVVIAGCRQIIINLKHQKTNSKRFGH
jgi:ribosomal protein S12 methylthiotransferase